MYTLRRFKEGDQRGIENIYLGDSYAVIRPDQKAEENNIKMWVYGNYDALTKDGLTIHKDENAYVMTHLGSTFETLNRVVSKSNFEDPGIVKGD